MWRRLKVFFDRLLSKPEPIQAVAIIETPKPVRKKVDTSAIRARIAAQGWKILEIPIKKNSPKPEERLVVRWKIVVTKGDKSIEAGGLTIDEAIANAGKFLGLIPR